ncbi:hypothetical protein Tco_0873663 [Tanacetum coccineum]|uniref:RNA-directed DNA polymerase, eukaryota, reverse transcriptase zinc-binding domain protein n=1 Tax=Tanacetum coccineum TaxID=301880 RepID=A0ABQ5BMB5_9ASTR
MSRIHSWKETIESMVTRLSKWKLKTLSIGGRRTLLKLVLGSMPIYHMSIFKTPMKVLQCMESIRSQFFNGVDRDCNKPIWVKWKNVLSPKDKGGLGVSSLFALNRALMFKWVWHFITQSSSLWAKVIKALHGEDGKIRKKTKSCYSSIWLDIIQEVKRLKSHGWLSFRSGCSLLSDPEQPCSFSALIRTIFLFDEREEKEEEGDGEERKRAVEEERYRKEKEEVRNKYVIDEDNYELIQVRLAHSVHELLSLLLRSNSFISDGANRYGARATGAAPGIKSIWNSTGRAGGRPGKSSGNTLGKSRTIVEGDANQGLNAVEYDKCSYLHLASGIRIDRCIVFV